MSNKHFTMLVGGLAKPGMEDYVRHYLSDLMKRSRQEPGCIIYNIHQSTENPRDFILYSVWEDEQAYRTHNALPEVKELKEKLANELFEAQSPKSYWELID